MRFCKNPLGDFDGVIPTVALDPFLYLLLSQIVDAIASEDLHQIRCSFVTFHGLAGPADEAGREHTLPVQMSGQSNRWAWILDLEGYNPRQVVEDYTVANPKDKGTIVTPDIQQIGGYRNDDRSSALEGSNHPEFTGTVDHLLLSFVMHMKPEEQVRFILPVNLHTKGHFVVTANRFAGLNPNQFNTEEPRAF